MSKTRSQVVSIIIGLVLAGLFLYFTFRQTDFSAMTDQILRVSWVDTLILFLMTIAMMLFRGARWWMLLPQPHTKGELWAAERALAIGYGINNVASRIGELFRIGFFKKDTGRDLGGITTTVVADRLVYDMMPFAFLMSLTLYIYRGPVMEAFPEIGRAFPLFLIAIGIGLVGLTILALRPLFLKHILIKFGLPKLPGLWNRIDHLITDLSNGLATVSKPIPFLKILIFNTIFIWGLTMVYYYLSVRPFGIQLDAGQLLLVFTVSSLGVLIPSPGGMGSVHFFMTTALVSFLGVEQTTAAAAAAYSHGINYLGLTLCAVFFFPFARPIEKAPEA
ncbi:MAG: lysylphosphatidylglycerol synthase transmembrane domain-containing protein [Acidobacteriota bacterium]|nr:lysylphosphatidylglycerol synthase transmembrane domain-containing protein [Acidobacteriota bacterium]